MRVLTLWLFTPYILSCRATVEGDIHVALEQVRPSSSSLLPGDEVHYELTARSAESDPATTTMCSHTVFPELAIVSATCSPGCTATLASRRGDVPSDRPLRLPIVVGSDSPGFKEVVVAYRVTGPETDSTDQVEGRIYFHDPAAAAPTPAADDGGADGRADAQTD